jgi:trehalose 2-sulfotransferase
MTSPSLAYLVCATPRVGSSYLCSALGGVPGAGDPTEWFGRAMLHLRAGEWGLRDPRSATDQPRLTASADYLRRVRGHATTNGALAFKVHWNQVRWCRDELGMDVFGVFGGREDIRYVQLWRQDLVAQTVSSYIASFTKIYHRYAGRPNVPIEEFAGMRTAEPEYDFEHLLAVLLELATHEAGWDAYFAEAGHHPYRLAYEDLESDLLGTVNGVLGHLGLPSAAATGSDLVKQRDVRNDEFAARFRADLADRALLEVLPESVRLRCASATTGS